MLNEMGRKNLDKYLVFREARRAAQEEVENCPVRVKISDLSTNVDPDALYDAIQGVTKKWLLEEGEENYE